jgi:hypothetical protein
MAPFFELNIIQNFLQQITIFNDIKIITNGSHELDDYLPNIIENAFDLCRGLIGNQYLEDAILSNAFNENTVYDAAVLFEDNDDTPLAFLVVEKGECKRLRNVWSVNLICAKEKSKTDKKGLGQILMGLYLFTIVHNSNIHAADKYGILELAGAYINFSGLASYSKLGFEVDEDFWGENCFYDFNNLPMSANSINSNRIIKILNNEDSGYPKPALCNLRGNMQLYLGICKNLFIFMFNVPANQQDKYIKTYYKTNNKINYLMLQQTLMNEYIKINGTKTTNLKGFQIWFTNLIDSIEKNEPNPPGFSNFSVIVEDYNVKVNSAKIVEDAKSKLQLVFRPQTRSKTQHIVSTHQKKQALKRQKHTRYSKIKRTRHSKRNRTQHSKKYRTQHSKRNS